MKIVEVWIDLHLCLSMVSALITKLQNVGVSQGAVLGLLFLLVFIVTLTLQ